MEGTIKTTKKEEKLEQEELQLSEHQQLLMEQEEAENAKLQGIVNLMDMSALTIIHKSLM